MPQPINNIRVRSLRANEAHSQSSRSKAKSQDETPVPTRAYIKLASSREQERAEKARQSSAFPAALGLNERYEKVGLKPRSMTERAAAFLDARPNLL